VILAIANCALASDAAPAARVEVDPSAGVHIFSMVVPYSTFASAESKAEFLRLGDQLKADAKAQGIAAQRQAVLDRFRPALERTRILYPVDSVATRIGGVNTDVFTPKGGIAAKNKRRVLINLHGGGFVAGAHLFGDLESIPVASLGKVRVVAVDYRQGPEYKFPAASEDVAAVYRELLKTYPARNIGIYGCSAGGLLAAEVVAWIAKENLPKPGAVGLFCGGAVGWWTGGDSTFLEAPLLGIAPSPIERPGYFTTADANDPLVQPIRSARILAQFPPTLLISATRDGELSSVVYTHTQLVKFGIDADLHVWEGMVHAFFTIYPDIPETREALDVITSFFDKRLGTE
jgi:monoterpene epsilon-lactone hydrolase